jgi:hypothetical protein
VAKRQLEDSAWGQGASSLMAYLVLPEKEYNYLILLLKIRFLKARFCNFLSSYAQKVAISGSTLDHEGSGKRR